jgi:hypothetical protein
MSIQTAVPVRRRAAPPGCIASALADGHARAVASGFECSRKRCGLCAIADATQLSTF